MAATYTGVNGIKYTVIEPPIGRGGEGSVYRIEGRTNYVLKAFAPARRTESRKRKLLAMIKTPVSGKAMTKVTWPVDVVFENGKFAGYVMPELKNSEDLNVLYSDKYICTLDEKITIAMKLCAAIDSVHKAGQVCGDLNPKNISVDPGNDNVILVDTDSYHIIDKNSSRVYRCEVGMPEYLPREVQNKMKNGYNLVNAPLPTFTKQTDLFALAVHIFALLMNGCHPFACATSRGSNLNRLSINQPSVVAPQPIENICNGFFPFYMKKSGITTPLYAPEFDMLPEKIQALFVKAFVDGHDDPTKRPDTVEWFYALQEMKANLSVCRKNNEHVYPSHLQKCPWCEVEKKICQKAPVAYNPPTPKERAKKITAAGVNTVQNPVSVSTKVFWATTISIPILIHLAVHFATDGMLIGGLFGYEYGSGIESLGDNLGILLGPAGFIICGLIGTYIYNTYWSKKGKLFGYKWYHYVLSIITSLAASVLWILVVIVLSIAILIILGILGIVILIGFFSS